VPFLVRWKSEEATVTIRAQRVVTSSVLDDHIRLLGVAGLNDNDHPDIEIHTLDIPKTEIAYMAEGLTLEKEVAPAAPEPEPEPEPESEPEPEPEPDEKKVTASRSRSRVRRERRVRSNKMER